MKRFAIVVALLCIKLNIATAAVVGIHRFSEEYSLPLGIGVVASNALTIRVAYSVSVGGLEDSGTTIFESMLFTENDDLQVFSLSGVQDPELPAFLARATNGNDDDFRVTVIGNNGGGGGKIDAESFAFERLANNLGPDFERYRLSGVELYIAEILFNPEATTSEVNWTVSGEVRLLGEPVPLPGSVVLLATGIAILRRRSRARVTEMA
jgi:hypothetical protein